jgi:arylamine N-acetyltransferase
LDVAAYLDRLGVDHPGPPSVPALYALHRAHVERVPYETLEIHLGVPTTVDPMESAERIVRRKRGGYCFHLNGAFAALLAALGYQVRWHRGGVQSRTGALAPGANANHLALTVHDLPAAECPAGVWFVDVGLGDALHEPLSLLPGRYRQGPFSYELRHSAVEPAGWRFNHDPAGSFAGMDFTTAVARPADFAARHVELSTSPESGFVRVFTAQRRHAGGVDALRGRVLTSVDAAGVRRREITRAGEWFEVLSDVFGLTLHDVSAEDRRALWGRVHAAHGEWAARQESR